MYLRSIRQYLEPFVSRCTRIRRCAFQVGNQSVLLVRVFCSGFNHGTLTQYSNNIPSRAAPRRTSKLFGALGAGVLSPFVFPRFLSSLSLSLFALNTTQLLSLHVFGATAAADVAYEFYSLTSSYILSTQTHTFFLSHTHFFLYWLATSRYEVTASRSSRTSFYSLLSTLSFCFQFANCVPSRPLDIATC